MTKAIAAVYADWGIGRDGTQPVTLRADRKRFREVTERSAVIVGRRTLEDFPGGRPLKNRKNIVLTRQSIAVPGALTAHSPEEALALAGADSFVIGGASVYRQMLPYIDAVYVTKIDLTPASDSFFPNLDEDPAFYLAEEGEPLSEEGIGYRFCLYERRR